MNTYGVASNIDFSDVSVGADLAGAMAAEAAAQAGASAGEQADAAAQAREDYGDRNPNTFSGPTGMMDMVGALSRSRVGRAFSAAMDKLGMDKDKDKGFDFGKQQDFGNMISTPDAVENMSFNVDQTAVSPQQVAAMNMTQRAVDAVNKASNPDLGFLSDWAGKAGKKGVNVGIQATALGATPAQAVNFGFNAIGAMGPQAMVGPAVGAIGRDIGNRNAAQEAMSNMAQANPEMTDREVAEAVSAATGTSLESVENMQAGDFGGKPDARGPEGSDADKTETVGRTSSRDDEQAPGAERVPDYQYSPLKDYLQSMYASTSQGYMSDPYSGQGGGAYNFRY
jgi:hypothetical protein